MEFHSANNGTSLCFAKQYYNFCSVRASGGDKSCTYRTFLHLQALRTRSRRRTQETVLRFVFLLLVRWRELLALLYGTRICQSDFGE